MEALLKLESDPMHAFQQAVDEPNTAVLEGLLKEFVPRVLDKSKLFEPTARPNRFTFPGYSVLHYASVEGRHEHVRLLLGAAPGGDHAKLANLASHQGVLPLHAAAAHGQAEVVKILLAAGADPGATPNNAGMSAVSMAARGGFTNVLKAYRQHGGNAVLALGARDTTTNKWSAMHYALHNGHIDTFRFILFEVGWTENNVKEVLALAPNSKKLSDKLIEDEITPMGRTMSDKYMRLREKYWKKQEADRGSKDDWKASKAKNEL